MTQRLDLAQAQHFLHEALSVVMNGGDLSDQVLENLLKEIQTVVAMIGDLPGEERETYRVQMLDLEHGHDELVQWLRMRRDIVAEELKTLADYQRAEQSYLASEGLAHHAS
jgi:hypothetical protein